MAVPDSEHVRAGIVAVAAHLSYTDLLSLVATATGGDVVINSAPDQRVINTNILVQFSVGDPRQFLERRKISKAVLFAYLQQVDPTALGPNIKLPHLVEIVLNRWAAALPAAAAAAAAVPVAHPDPEPSITDVLPGQLWNRLTALATEHWDGTDCFENVGLQVRLTSPAGQEAGMQCAGIAAVSGWLRAFSTRLILKMTEGVAEPIDHNHGYKTVLRGNVHAQAGPAGMVGVFRLHFLMVEPPGDGGELLIQQVQLELVYNHHSDLAALAGVPELGFAALQGPGPGPGQHQLGPGGIHGGAAALR